MMNATERRVPKRWTVDEDRILHDETQKQATSGSVKDWHRIATKLPGRTNKDCRKRWINKVCGSLKKGAWKDDEDERLLGAVERHGQKWTLVANEVGFRSPDQCSKRWQSKLDPNLEHGGWTAKEDNLLLTLVQETGREWKRFQEQNFPRRSTNEIKNRFTVLSRRPKRTGSIICYSPSNSSSSEAQADGDDGCEPDGSTAREIEGIDSAGLATPEFPSPQHVTEEWVDMLDTPSMLIDQSNPHDSLDDVGALLDACFPEDPSLMNLLDIQNLTMQQGQGSIEPVPSTNPMCTMSPGWTEIQYDACSNIQMEDQMLLDSISGPQNDDKSAEDRLMTNYNVKTGLAPLQCAEATVGNVGKVSLVIDECDRDMFYHLLDWSKSLGGKSKIEIDTGK